MNLKEDILSFYNSLPPKITSYIRFLNNNIRQKDIQGQLERVCFSYSIYMSVHAKSCGYPYTIMITASHNPPCQNGLKIEELGPNNSFNSEELENIMNNEQNFREYLNNNLPFLQKEGKAKPVNFFIGRDTRPTSLGLSKIIIQALEMTGNKVIDLGECSTPEVLSLSEYIFQNIVKEPKLSVEDEKKGYFSQIESTWKRALQLLSQKTGRQWLKKSIYFDFSNGVGAVSALNYPFIHDYFNITKTHDKDFDKPNVQCGAEWIYNQRLNLSKVILPEADNYIWLDGDADRILAKLKNDKQLTQGQDFIICFIKLIKTLLQAFDHSLSISCVSPIIINSGLGTYLKEEKIIYEQTCLGTRNLYNKAKTYDISVFFQRNGHGSIYFSEKALNLFKQMQNQYWQAELLLLIHNLSRNNVRGYAFHNFLIFELYLFFTGKEKSLFFEKDFSIDELYEPKKPQLFVNSIDGLKLLEKPQALVQQINEVCLKYSELLIKIRRSSTSQILRLSLQGKEALCKEVLPILDEIVKKYI